MKYLQNLRNVFFPRNSNQFIRSEITEKSSVNSRNARIMKKSQVNKLIIATFGGALSGAVLGLLFAPEKGSTTRKNITKSGNKYFKKMNEELKRLNKQVNKQAKTARKGLQDIGENAKSKGKALYKRTKKLTSYDEWTKEELYGYAKEKGIEGYSKMNKEELIVSLRDL